MRLCGRGPGLVWRGLRRAVVEVVAVDGVEMVVGEDEGGLVCIDGRRELARGR
jgi:hypothetical protein